MNALSSPCIHCGTMIHVLDYPYGMCAPCVELIYARKSEFSLVQSQKLNFPKLNSLDVLMLINLFFFLGLIILLLLSAQPESPYDYNRLFD